MFGTSMELMYFKGRFVSLCQQQPARLHAFGTHADVSHFISKVCFKAEASQLNDLFA